MATAGTRSTQARRGKSGTSRSLSSVGQRSFSVVASVRRTKTEAYGLDWSTVSKKIKQRDGYKCVKCRSTTQLEVHHIIPVHRGGKTIGLNLVTLCHSCHSKQPGHSHLHKSR